MSLARHIIHLLRDEGYRINEAIEDAVDEFVTLVEEENEGVVEELAADGEAEVEPGDE